MDGKKVTVVAIVAVLVGLLVGWLFWGSGSRALQDELARVRAQAQQATQQEQTMSARLAQVEAQLKALQDQLAKEKEEREKLQTRGSRGKK